MKRRPFYLVINKKNKHTFGAFPRTKDGRAAAKEYKEKLLRENKDSSFIIK